jgi:peptidoglycan/LPS O-acetylase OafA/YrhL
VGRNLWLDLIRIVGAATVFVAHQQQAGGIQLGDVGFNGRLGIYLFFVLSGHLVGGLFRPGAPAG